MEKLADRLSDGLQKVLANFRHTNVIPFYIFSNGREGFIPNVRLGLKPSEPLLFYCRRKLCGKQSFKEMGTNAVYAEEE